MINLKAIRYAASFDKRVYLFSEDLVELLDRLEAAEKQLAIYEKHGVACQTFRHKLTGCAECNRDDFAAMGEQT